jgi:hypothetical protein
MKLALIVSALAVFLVSTVRGEDTNISTQDLARTGPEYADVLALQGTAKQEILAIARILRANPQMAIDKTAAAGEFCLKSGSGTMVHFASNPALTREGIVYEFDASELIKAGLNPERLAKMPSLGGMEPGRWYFLPPGTVDPHHKHAMPAPTIAIAQDVRQ